MVQKESPLKALFTYESGDRRYERVLVLLEQRITYVARKRVPEEFVRDIVQDTLLTLLKKLPSLNSETEILPYTFLILRQLIGNLYQSQKTLKKFSGMNLKESSCNPSADIEARVYLDQLLAKCDEVNGDYSRIVRLVLKGYTPTEIAREIECPSMQALYSKIHRSRTLLKAIMRELEKNA
jgi:RNA polymerase sigma factor (sigma-70 family)